MLLSSSTTRNQKSRYYRLIRKKTDIQNNLTLIKIDDIFKLNIDEINVLVKQIKKAKLLKKVYDNLILEKIIKEIEPVEELEIIEPVEEPEIIEPVEEPEIIEPEPVKIKKIKKEFVIETEPVKKIKKINIKTNKIKFLKLRSENC